MLRALADGTRRQILSMVWKRELSAGEIAEHFRVSRPAISQHLRILLLSQLLRLRREGTRRLYKANRESIMTLRAELGSLWDEGLARLKKAAEADEASRER